MFPTPTIPGSADNWWKTSTRDFSWWLVWFDHYRTFLINHADLADRQNADAFIIGGNWVNQSLPGGLLADGTNSNVPQDAEIRWRTLIKDIRDHYKGPILWALPYQKEMKNIPPFLDAVDQVYLLWSAPLEKAPGAPQDDMAKAAGTILDNEVHPIQVQLNKPLILSVAYPSISGSAMGCIPSPKATSSTCLDLDSLARPNPDLTDVTLSLQEQASAYNAMLIAVNERAWISGLIARGYYPPAVLQDKSTSIHGKPARDVLWYWFQKMLNKQ
jgi:hypothetical protein